MMTSELTFKSLKKVFPNECSIAGNTNVHNIAKGTRELVHVPGGSNFDISTILEFLVSATSLIANAITVILFHREKHRQPPTPAQIEIKIETNIIINSRINEEKRLELYQFLLEELDKENENTSHE